MPKSQRLHTALPFLRRCANWSLPGLLVFISCSMGCSNSSGGIVLDDEPWMDEAATEDATSEPDARAPDAGPAETPGDGGRPPLVKALSYSDVRPIFTSKCSGDSCHSPTDTSRPALAASDRALALEEARRVARRITQVIESGEMPFGRRCVVDGEVVMPEPEGCLTPMERTWLLNWVAQGTPDE